MAFCQKCGNQVSDGAGFCPACGTKTDGPIPQARSQSGVRTRYCKKCNTSTPVDQIVIQKGKTFATGWEQFISLLLFLALFFPWLIYGIYLWNRKIWICPNCNAKEAI
jgi:RNA polymerase subunit RPABC4/transcription elongation factor Spt4